MSLIVGQPVIAAEAHVVAEEGEPQRIGHRLGDDRQIDAGDARAKGEPAEHQGEHPRHQDHHRRGIGEMVEAPPEPRQFLILQEHHEVREHRVLIHPARADLAHQIHAHAHSRRARRTRRGRGSRSRHSPRPDRGSARASRSTGICRAAAPGNRAPRAANPARTARLSTGTRTTSTSAHNAKPIQNRGPQALRSPAADRASTLTPLRRCGP